MVMDASVANLLAQKATETIGFISAGEQAKMHLLGMKSVTAANPWVIILTYKFKNNLAITAELCYNFLYNLYDEAIAVDHSGEYSFVG